MVVVVVKGEKLNTGLEVITRGELGEEEGGGGGGGGFPEAR